MISNRITTKQQRRDHYLQICRVSKRWVGLSSEDLAAEVSKLAGVTGMSDRTNLRFLMLDLVEKMIGD